MKINNSNDTRDAMAKAVEELLSGKATNLDSIALAIKAASVMGQLQRNHHVECRVNGKTSVKQNPGWAKWAKEASTAGQEAKAKAKASKAEQVDNAKPQKLNELQNDLREITKKLEELQGYDKRFAATRDEIATQTERLRAVKARINELS